MKKNEDELISDVKIEAISKSIQKETAAMNFSSGDYIKLVNSILEFTVNQKKSIELDTYHNLSNKVKYKLPIETKNLFIREFRKSDTKLLKKWLEDDENKMFLLSTTISDSLNLEDLHDDNKTIFAIITLKDSTPIGTMALLNIDRVNKKAEMRKLIGDKNFRGKGYAKEASEVWLLYSTQTIGLNKIYISTFETNIHNISLNRQLGFKIEGYLRKEIIIDNIEHDILRMAYFK